MNSVKRSTICAIAASLFATLSLTAPAQTLFSDDFDSYSSPSTITAAAITNGYKVVFGAASGAQDFSAIFGFDYSTVTFPTTIPSAPNSLGGTTKGLFLTVNKDATGAAAAVNLYPTNQSFSGNFSLTFDLWINWTNLATSTEHTLFGINHSGSFTNRVGQIGSDGLFFAMDGDGGSAPTSATLRDFSVFRGNAAAIPTLLTTGFGPTPPLGPNFDNTNTAIAAFFPSKTIPGYPTTPAGTPGLGWLSCEVRQETNVITWAINGTIIAQYTNTSSFGSGNIMLGYNDNFASIGDLADFALFDNIKVTALGGLPVVTVTSPLTTASEDGAKGLFTIQRVGDSSAALTVNYTLGGTASNGVDYVTLPGTITFAAGASVTNISVTAIDDSIPEPVETVVLTLATGAGYTVGAPSAATVAILDNETPSISIASAQPILLEGVNAAKVPITLTRLGRTNTTISANGVNLSYSGTAAVGVDFNAPSKVTIPAGVVTVTTNITPINDALVEGTETAVVSVAAGSDYTIGSLSSVIISVIDDDLAPGVTLFSDTFDSAADSANWTVNQSSGDTFADFGYDYSADGIPEAPSSTGAFTATRGLRLRANESIGTVAGLSASPLNGDFENNYRLRFDMWLNYAGPLNNASVPGQTQSGSAGVGVTGTEPVWPFGSMSSGVWFSATGDGGSGAGPGDYNAYSATTLYDDLSGIYAAGTNAPRDNLNAYYAPWPAVSAPAAQVTAHPTQTGTTGVGTFGEAWHKVAITKHGTNVTWDVDGRRLATVDISALSLSANIFVGYHDPFASLTTNAAAQFGLFDNVRVETLSRPTIIAIAYQGTSVQIDFTGDTGDTIADFEIQTAALVDGTYVPTAATITPNGNLFHASVPVSSASKGYFRVHRL